MDRKFLQKLEVEGLEGGLPKAVIDEIMAEYGQDFKEKEKQIETLTTEKEGIQQQLEEANKQIQSFKDINVDDLNKQITEWETKYNQDTENLKNELSKKDYDYKIKDLANSLKFSSNGAKRAFLEDLKEKGLEFNEDGKLDGFDDFVNSYKETDPDTFLKEEPKEDGFVANTGAEHEDKSEDDAFINKIMGLN